jgi:hypothetical protein
VSVSVSVCLAETETHVEEHKKTLYQPVFMFVVGGNQAVWDRVAVGRVRACQRNEGKQDTHTEKLTHRQTDRQTDRPKG